MNHRNNTNHPSNSGTNKMENYSQAPYQPSEINRRSIDMEFEQSRRSNKNFEPQYGEQVYEGSRFRNNDNPISDNYYSDRASTQRDSYTSNQREEDYERNYSNHDPYQFGSQPEDYRTHDFEDRQGMNGSFSRRHSYDGRNNTRQLESGQQSFRNQNYGQGQLYSRNSGSGYSSERTSQAGVGPKSYKRTDERLKEDICERLMQDHYIDAKELSVEVKDGQVTLSGSVSERSMKYSAENIADNTFGVNDIQNEIRVTRPGKLEQEDSTRSTSSKRKTSNSASKV